MVPVGCTDATAASVYFTKDRAEVCPEAEIKDRTQKTPSRCGAQSDEPNGAERDGDEQMRRDAGLAGLIAAVCRSIRRFLSCL